MFTNILVATDGSNLAAKGVSAGIRLARKHGYGALGGLILGSETQRVLAQAKVPVLVTR
jgi:nucleotide-binding universal stress UspA family protein